MEKRTRQPYNSGDSKNGANIGIGTVALLAVAAVAAFELMRRNREAQILWTPEATAAYKAGCVAKGYVYREQRDRSGNLIAYGCFPPGQDFPPSAPVQGRGLF